MAKKKAHGLKGRKSNNPAGRTARLAKEDKLKSRNIKFSDNEWRQIPGNKSAFVRSATKEKLAAKTPDSE